MNRESSFVRPANDEWNDGKTFVKDVDKSDLCAPDLNNRRNCAKKSVHC